MTKRTLLSICMMMIVWTLSAQITITKQNMPQANDTVRYVNVINPLAFNAQIGQDGANQFWVFPESNTPITSLVEYKSSLKTPYAFYFFNTVGQKIADSIGLAQFKLEDVYQFYSSKSGAYSIEGLGFKLNLAPLPLAGNYQTEDIVYKFPLNYGNRDSSNYKVKINIPLIGAYVQTGHRITQVVGHGKVVVVNDTLECLKLRADIIGADTFETQLGKFGFPSHRIEYKWLTLEHRHPVVEITGNEIAGQFVPTQTKYMALEPKIDTGNGGGGPNSVINPVFFDYPLVFPNPATHVIIKNSVVTDIEAYSMQGSRQEIRWEDRTGHINWLSGVYVLRITKKDGSVEVVKMIVAH